MNVSASMRQNVGKHPKLQIPVLVQHSKSLVKKSEPNAHQLTIPQDKVPSQLSNRSKSSTKPLGNFGNHQAQESVLKNQGQGIFDIDLDIFLEIAMQTTPGDAIEQFFNKKYHGVTCYWEDIPSLSTLFSASFNKTCRRDLGLAGECFVAREVIRVDDLLCHQAFNQEVDGSFTNGAGSAMLIPLWNSSNSLVGVIEVFKTNGPFTETDEAFAGYFIKKFKYLSHWMYPPAKFQENILDIVQLLSFDQFASVFHKKLTNLFNCRTAEAWIIKNDDDEITIVSDMVNTTEKSNGGIVYDCVVKSKTLNCQNNKLHSMYNPKIDGIEEAMLVVPVIQPNGPQNFAVVLRGPKNKKLFTNADEQKLKRLAPYIALGLANADSHTHVFDEFQNSSMETDGLAALLEVAEILGGQLELDKIVETIMAKGSELTKSDRCSVFLVDETGERLESYFHKGLPEPIELPISRGIAGKCALSKRVVNIPCASEDPDFDDGVDKESGYETKNLLCVPIFSPKGELIGVTEMINKIDGPSFSQWDAKVIQIFNVFCGIAIENARLYKSMSELTSQLQSFFDVTVSLSKDEDLVKCLNDIMRNARVSINAERASVFLVDPAAGVLKSFLADGGEVPPTLSLETGIAATSARTDRSIISNDVYHDPRFNREIDSRTGFLTRNIIVAPLKLSNGEVIGVAQLLNKDGPFIDRDLKMLESFATFASVALEKSKLKEIAALGSAEVEMQQWIGESERESTTEIPSLLRLTEEQEKEMRQLNFMALEWTPIDRVKILFSLFYEFGITEEFMITNEMLFRFIYEVHKTYHQVPYHNWIHAVDVSQYVTYEIRTAGVAEVLTKFELLAMLVAAICHDAGHDGFNNVYNVKAETPLGILFKDQSVMETHHCTVAISILTRDECNLFHAIGPEDIKKMWTLIIKLILATDMAFHFKLVKQAQEALDAGPFSMEDPEQRLLATQLLIKVADISNVSRPFKIADKWCDVLNNEFWRQGDNEKEQGFGLTSPLNDREHPDKPKSQIGFYNFICIPLYTQVARIFQPLSVNLESVKSNLEVWKSLSTPSN